MLGSKSTSHKLAYHPNLALGKVEDACHFIAHTIRVLGRCVDRHEIRSPVDNHAMSFKRHVGMDLGAIGSFNHYIRFAEAFVQVSSGAPKETARRGASNISFSFASVMRFPYITPIRLLLNGLIKYNWGIGLHGLFHVNNKRFCVVAHLNQGNRVFGDVQAFRRDPSKRLTDIFDRRIFSFLFILSFLAFVLYQVNGINPRQTCRFRYIDRPDLRMWNSRAQHLCIEHTRQFHVGGVLCLTRDLVDGVNTLNSFANVLELVIDRPGRWFVYGDLAFYFAQVVSRNPVWKFLFSGIHSNLVFLRRPT